MYYVIFYSQLRDYFTSDISAYNNPACTKSHHKMMNTIIMSAHIFINRVFKHSLHYPSIPIFQSKIFTYGNNQYVIICFLMLIWILFLHVFRYVFGLYFVSSFTCKFSRHLKYGRVLWSNVSLFLSELNHIQEG